MAVAARVPREDGDILQSERLHRVLPAAGVLVATMEKQKRLVSRLGGKPCAIKKFRPIPGLHWLRNGLHKVKLARFGPEA
jgi:hypothetical protein